VQSVALESVLDTQSGTDPSNPEQRDLLLHRYALHCLYHATNFNKDHWTNKAGWLSSTPYCSWFGLTCANDLIHITDLVLNQNGLAGFLPSKIRGLTALTRLELSNAESGSTYLTRDIPSKIGELTLLEFLDLLFHRLGASISSPGGLVQMADTIPHDLSNLVKLKILNLEDNYFAENILFDALSQLTSLIELRLPLNAFTGQLAALLPTRWAIYLPHWSYWILKAIR
jgi:hypothetical protein